MKNDLNIIRDKKIGVYYNVEKTEKLNIILYLASKTISLLGTNVYNFVLALYILKVTGSGSSFAMNVLICMLPKIILGPFAGILADRVNRKKLTIAFDILSGLIVFILLGCTSIYGLNVINIYITSFILSVINVFYDTSLTSSLPDLVRDEKLMKINSYSSVSASVSGILSPILAGIVYGLIPINLILIINGLSFVFSSILEMFIDFNLNNTLDLKVKNGMTFNIFKTEIKEVMRFVKQQKIMHSLLKYVLLINLFLSASMSVVYPYVINNVLMMSPEQYGIFESFYFIGMIVSSIIIGSKKEKRVTGKKLGLELAIIGLTLILTGIQTIGFKVFKLQTVLCGYNMILLFIMGALIIVINTPIMVIIQRLTPENLRGRITGILGTLSGGITPLGVIGAGLLIDKIYPYIILSVSGVIIILSAVHMIWDKDMESL